jgi:glycosyltransferase involved in cell wall biosynthesis
VASLGLVAAVRISGDFDQLAESRVRIGISALQDGLGSSGGVDVYTRLLVEALATYDTENEYLVIVSRRQRDSWKYRKWPSNMRFVERCSRKAFRSLLVYMRHQLGDAFSFPVQSRSAIEAMISDQIDSLGLDLIHHPSTTIYPISASTPCVLTFFDMQHEYYPQFFIQSELGRRSQTYKASVDKASLIIVPSRYTQKTLMEKYGTLEAKIKRIPVGICDAFQPASPTEIARVRAKYSLPEQFVFYPANPWPHKNHARLMAAIRILKEHYGQPVNLVLSGRLLDEPRDATLLAVAAGVEAEVVDLGYVPLVDLPAFYSMASFMIFPSLFEGFGIPLVEAMACSCPIAAADATAIPECVNGAALLFNPFDAGAIAESMHRMLGDEELQRDLVRKGRQQLPRFSWECIVRRLVSVYEQVSSKSRDLR